MFVWLTCTVWNWTEQSGNPKVRGEDRSEIGGCQLVTWPGPLYLAGMKRSCYSNKEPPSPNDFTNKFGNHSSSSCNVVFVLHIRGPGLGEAASHLSFPLRQKGSKYIVHRFLKLLPEGIPIVSARFSLAKASHVPHLTSRAVGRLPSQCVLQGGEMEHLWAAPVTSTGRKLWQIPWMPSL